MPYYKSRKRAAVPFFTTEPGPDAFDSSSKSKYSFSFHLDAPSKMEIRVSHYGSDPILHLSKGERYLPMKESEFHDIMAESEDIVKKIESCRRFVLKGGKRMKKGEGLSFKIIKKSEKSAKVEEDKRKRLEESESSADEMEFE